MHSRRNIIVVILNITFIAWTLGASYGKFDVSIGDSRPCKGPRRKDCGHITQKVITTSGEDPKHELYLEVFENVVVDVIRILGYKAKSAKNAPPIINLTLDNPCSQTIIVGSKNSLLLTEQGCLARKGKYNYTVDARSMAQKLWGGSFFYGNFTFKSMIYGLKCNLLCSIMNITYSPKI